MRHRKGALLPLLLLVASAYAFWILPHQLAKPKMQIKFERPSALESGLSHAP